MKVAIISDIHDNLANLRSALAQSQHADVLICLGDLCSPFIIRELGQGFAKPIHIVFGNNDGDRFRMAMIATKFPQITIHGEYAELELGGKSFFINHFDGIGRPVAKSGIYDVVCYGHNHAFEITPTGKTTVINPGELFGGLTGYPSFVIHDTELGATQIVKL